MASMREIARRAGLAPSTVSRVLGGTLPVRAETLDRIRQAMADLNCAPPAQAAPAQASDLAVGVILPSSSGESIESHPVIFEVINSFLRAMRRLGVAAGLQLMSEAQAGDVGAFLTPLLSGYLIVGTSPAQEDALLDDLARQGIPGVIVNRWLDRPQVSCVNMDDVRATFEATEHLIGLGHRRIAFVCGERHFRHSRMRLRGYADAMHMHGLAVREEYLRFGDYKEVFGYIAGRDLLALDERPTAAVAASEPLALGLQRRLREKGVKLPGEFAIISFGCNTNAAQPPLTAIDVPAAAMGEQAADTLLRMIRQPQIRQVQVLLAADLIVRESSGGKIARG